MTWDASICGARHQVGAWDDKHPFLCTKPAGHDARVDRHSGYDIHHERVRAEHEADDFCICGYPLLGPREPDD